MNRRKIQNSTDYQVLETRNVLAANPIVTFAGGEINIQGTELNDTVRVTEVDNEVRVAVQSAGEINETFVFESSEVESLYFSGKEGDDLFVNRTSLSSTAYGNDGDDLLIGGTGSDVLRGGNGDDDLRGNRGDDSLHGDYGNDKLVGMDGNDRLLGWYGNDILVGNAGDDYVSGYKGDDILFGSAGNDIIKGHEGNDFIGGGDGDDQIYGWLGNDRLFGGEGDDYLSGYHGDDTLAGQAGDDVLKGHEGRDRIFGGDGEDKLYGWLGNDLINGGEGNDELWGGDGDDILVGWHGNDILHGDHGDDLLFGGQDDDVLIGYYGNDRLVGGAGGDMLCGGYDHDSYVGIDADDVGYDPDGDFANAFGANQDNTVEEETWQAYNEALEEWKTVSEAAAATVDYDVDPQDQEEVTGSTEQNKLYLNDSQGNLSSYDTETGEYQLIGSLGTRLTDIAMSASGDLYGISFNSLYRIDATTAETVYVGSLGRSDVNALTFTADGRLLAAGFAGNGLYEVNLESGRMTYQGNMGVRSSGDLAVHEGQVFVSSTRNTLVSFELNDNRVSNRTVVANVAGTTYGLASQGENQLFSASGSQLFELNDETGQTTSLVDLSSHGVSSIWGMTEGVQS